MAFATSISPAVSSAGSHYDAELVAPRSADASCSSRGSRGGEERAGGGQAGTSDSGAEDERDALEMAAHLGLKVTSVKDMNAQQRWLVSTQQLARISQSPSRLATKCSSGLRPANRESYVHADLSDERWTRTETWTSTGAGPGRASAAAAGAAGAAGARAGAGAAAAAGAGAGARAGAGMTI